MIKLPRQEEISTHQISSAMKNVIQDTSEVNSIHDKQSFTINWSEYFDPGHCVYFERCGGFHVGSKRDDICSCNSESVFQPKRNNKRRVEENQNEILYVEQTRGKVIKEDRASVPFLPKKEEKIQINLKEELVPADSTNKIESEDVSLNRCKYYDEGNCNFGDSCKNYHAPDRPPVCPEHKKKQGCLLVEDGKCDLLHPAKCKRYQEGKCKQKKRCIYYHPNFEKNEFTFL
ncbi:hypothetical protein QYM36_007757 [Artemia franciscana]|uniref:C3H1-type domain-containing protein n=1 Tax=Artemia franciscana TaxID=6661 RepID=A0AA88ISZ4_ARTSF|nr:hypothetical protein QYM36_007757 [Artemia franciscana]